MEFKIKPRTKTPVEKLKANILGQYTIKQKEITKRQREYRRLFITKLKSRKAHIVETGVLNTTERLCAEKNTLKAKIWVAAGAEHLRNTRRNLKNIQCHILCQDRLAEDIRRLKTAIQNMKRAMSRVVKQMYELNRLTVPEMQHQEHVAKTRKRMQILEDRFEVGMRRECGFTAENATLRDELFKMLMDRTSFNETYRKVVQRLNSDKKYLIDLIEYALAKFENCIDVYEKTENLLKRNRRENEIHKVEMQSLIRRTQMDNAFLEFHHIKAAQCVLDNLQPKEYRRREQFRRKHSKKINLYNDVLDKILYYTKSRNVGSVISKFQEQENAYYSYFNYSNELSYHMTLLNNAVNRLYTDIDGLKKNNRDTAQEQLQAIDGLEKTLQEKKQRNEELKRVSENNDDRLEKLLQGVQLIQDQCRSDIKSLKASLGQHDVVDLHNMRRFLKKIERRVADVAAVTYIKERMDETKTYADYIVKNIEKICDWTTDLDEIVLTQQCPECAEVDAFNVDDSVEGMGILSMDMVRKKLYEKIQQPEMQYRLHSISQCRLPRSRILTSNKQER